MTYQYATESSASPSYYYDVSSLTWIPVLDSPQHPSAESEYWQDLFWDQVETEIQASPTNLSYNSITTHNASYDHYATSQNMASPSPSQSTLSQTSSSRHGSEDFITPNRKSNSDPKKTRRRIQNRDSQRAYRERTRKREEEMTSTIKKLQQEIETLRSQEKGSSQMIEALSKEIERLRELVLVL